jgi:predicted DNA-binding protein with PD1-like motif
MTLSERTNVMVLIDNVGYDQQSHTHVTIGEWQEKSFRPPLELLVLVGELLTQSNEEKSRIDSFFN